MSLAFDVLYIFLTIMFWAMFINAILSWFISPDNPIKRFLERIVEPIVRPFRHLLRNVQRNSPLDFSYMIAGFAIILLRWLIQTIRFRVGL